MASLIDELIEVLDGENKIYEAYVDIAREKTTFIVKNDLEGLSDIVGKEQLIIEHVNNLDKFINQTCQIRLPPSFTGCLLTYLRHLL